MACGVGVVRGVQAQRGGTKGGNGKGNGARMLIRMASVRGDGYGDVAAMRLLLWLQWLLELLMMLLAVDDGEAVGQ
jgi:hypothetical protein